VSTQRRMRRKVAGVKGTSQRYKDPRKNLRRTASKAAASLDGVAEILAERFGPKEEDEDGEGPEDG
jgi:hypothetical protein